MSDRISLRVDFDDGETLDESIASRTDLEELQLRNMPRDVRLPEALRSLPKLKVVGIAHDAGAVVPPLIADLNLDLLELWDCDVSALPPLPKVRSMYFVTSAPEQDVPRLLERAPQLQGLQLNGTDQTEASTLPDAISGFRALTELKLVRLGLSSLPESLTSLKLTSLMLFDNDFTQLPEVVCQLTGLTTLKVGERLAKLPDALAQLSRLEVLSLARSLNNGEFVYRMEEALKRKDLPLVLASLGNLVDLDLGTCSVRSGGALTEVLSALTKLKRLDLSWAGLSSLDALAPLSRLESLALRNVKTLKSLDGLERLTSLQELDLESAEIRDVRALAKLKSLKRLNLEYFETKDLGPVYELDVELKADEEVLEKYQARASLRGVPSFEVLLPRLASPDAMLVQQTLEQLTARSKVASGRKSALVAALQAFKFRDALSESLGATLIDADDDEPATAAVSAEEEDEDLDEDEEGFDEDDEDFDEDDEDGEAADEDSDEVIPLPVLESALDRHRGSVSPLVLGKLFGEVLRDVSANIPAALMIAREVAERGDDAAQLALVEGFKQACEFYDAGHRMHEDTVQDRLIDDVFPSLGPVAQGALLEWASDDALQQDHLDALFGPVFERGSGAPVEQATARLEKHLGRRLSDVERIDSLLKKIADTGRRAGEAVQQVRAKLEVQLAAAARLKALKKDLESEQATRVAKALEVLEADTALAKELQGALWDANKCPGLPLEATRTLVGLWSTLDHDRGLREAFARGVATHGREAMEDSAVALGLDGVELAAMLRTAAREVRDDERTNLGDDEVSSLLETLRAWATTLDGLAAHVAASNDLRADFFEAGEQFDSEAMAEHIETLAELETFEPGPLPEDARGSWSNVASVVATMAENQDWEPLELLVRHLHKLPLEGKTLERVLAQLIAVCSQDEDQEGLRIALALAPAKPTWDILAFNLACVTAAAGDKAHALEHIRNALELGKPPSQFMSDSDFKRLRKDPDFLALLAEFGGGDADDDADEIDDEDSDDEDSDDEDSDDENSDDENSDDENSDDENSDDEDSDDEDSDDEDSDDEDSGDDADDSGEPLRLVLVNEAGQRMELEASPRQVTLAAQIGELKCRLAGGDWLSNDETLWLEHEGRRMVIDMLIIEGEAVTITGDLEQLVGDE